MAILSVQRKGSRAIEVLLGKVEYGPGTFLPEHQQVLPCQLRVGDTAVGVMNLQRSGDGRKVLQEFVRFMPLKGEHGVGEFRLRRETAD